MRAIRSVAVLAIAALAAACGPSITYVKRPSSAALKGQKELAVAVTYDGLMIGNKTFEQYIADKQAKADDKSKDESASKWAEWRGIWAKDTASIVGEAVKGAGVTVKEVKAPGDAKSGVVVHVNVEAIEPGYYAVVAAGPSETRVRVRIFDAKKPGDVLYELTGTSGHSGYSTGGRVGDDIKTLASALGDALRGEL